MPANQSDTQFNHERVGSYKSYEKTKRLVQEDRLRLYEGVEFRFDSFDDWYAELGPRPMAQFAVERIDPKGHFEPGNVRWFRPKNSKGLLPRGPKGNPGLKWVRRRRGGGFSAIVGGLPIGRYETAEEAHQAAKNFIKRRH